MALRVDTVRTEPRDLPSPAFDVPPPTSAPPPHDPDALVLGDTLRRFLEASREEQKSAELAAVGGIVASPAEVDEHRSARIRGFFSRFAVEVPVLAGEQGETRKVAVPFRMSHPSTNGEYNSALLAALGSAPSHTRAGLVVAGRATPDLLAAVVRDLAQRHPEQFGPDRSAEQVRNYLRELGVGIDCAGAVQLALFDCHGLSPESGKAHFHLRPRLNEDLTQLDGKPQFKKLADPSLLRPGDLIILKPPKGEPVGHTVIVTQQMPATLTEEEASFLSREFPAVAGQPVVKVSVASSFGWEGPQERTWVYDPVSKSWADLGGSLFDDDGTGRRTPANSRLHSGPWDHAIQGMYHAR